MDITAATFTHKHIAMESPAGGGSRRRRSEDATSSHMLSSSPPPPPPPPRIEAYPLSAPAEEEWQSPLSSPIVAPTSLTLQRSTSSETSSGSSTSSFLGGLVRLVPMGMPRTSLRYKRHLSCADIDTFRAQEEAVAQELMRLEVACGMCKSSSSSSSKASNELEVHAPEDETAPPTTGKNNMLLPVALSSLAPSSSASCLLALPTLLPSIGSPTQTESVHSTTRIRRCVSMPAAPASHRRIRSESGEGELVVNFPGGGKFFYWQSGVATFLNKHFDLSHAKLVGASAGSLTATLMACHVDAHRATEVAVRILHKYNVWERSMGLVGVWGGVVRDWLHEILPDNAAELCSGRVHISVLCLPYRRHHVSEFTSKTDLIETCMASAHLPMVMDGKPFFMWRGWPCVDGSIMAGRSEVPQHLVDAEHVTFDYVADEHLMAQVGKKDFMTLSEPAGLKHLVERGYRFAERMSVGGRLPTVIQSTRRESSVEAAAAEAAAEAAVEGEIVRDEPVVARKPEVESNLSSSSNDTTSTIIPLEENLPMTPSTSSSSLLIQP